MNQIKVLTIFSLSFILLTGCKKNICGNGSQTDLATLNSTQDYSLYRICTELYPKGVQARGATLRNAQWTNGSKLKVSLNGGTAFIRSKIIKYASEWELYANIDFTFVENDNTADIRIEFAADNASWSYLGKYARQIPSTDATMHFGWFDDATSDEEFSRTSIHEFGHALGMIHEHQHPKASIPWDKDKVYTYYAQSQGWTRSEVDAQIFNKYSRSQTNFSSYDKSSIMHYPVQEELTVGTFSIGWNTVLSETDKTFIASVYPK